MGYSVTNPIDIRIKERLFRRLMFRKKFTSFKSFVETEVISKNHLNIQYKTIFQMVKNRNTWNLLYAYLICDALDTTIEQLFEVYDVEQDNMKKTAEKGRMLQTDS